jgi:hypothetical protein
VEGATRTERTLTTSAPQTERGALYLHAQARELVASPPLVPGAEHFAPDPQHALAVVAQALRVPVQEEVAVVAASHTRPPPPHILLCEPSGSLSLSRLRPTKRETHLSHDPPSLRKNPVDSGKSL